ncbi:sensor domain-containing protein [Aquabacterium sp.]|uniref:sensor domain-containing protein n=1 Tax=Aquabacterium sp. TaxID=1872578 RepID=UPI0025C634A8|nr:sensor domain-containing diguanylate cyclase [Aquabacterium sp.]MBI5924006.1 sensor domain-containing diguanylate cyclase [Aquabacterium sp.]
MSSLIHSMIMGTPTTHRRPSVAAQLLSTAGLALGIALSSSPHSSAQWPGALIASAAGLTMWLSHRRMHKSLQKTLQTERLWQAVATGCEVGIVMLQPRRDPLGRFMGYQIAQSNQQAHALLSADAAPLQGQMLVDVLPSQLQHGFLHRVNAAIESGLPQIEEHAYVRPGDQRATRWLHHQIIPIDGGVALVSRDTTEAHQAMNVAREREAFYRTLVDCLPMAVFARSTRPSSAGEYVVWNKASAEIMQLPADKVLGRKANGLLPPEITRRGDEQDLAVLRDPRIHHFPNLVYRTPLGERIVDLIKAPVYGVDGEVDHILSIAHDVTAQREAAEQLKLASRVIDETGDAIVVSDAVDRIVMVNPAFLNLTGMTPAEVIGRSAELLGMPPLRESHLPGVAQALRGSQRWSGESHQVCQDGRQLDTWLSVSTLRNDLQKITQHIRVFSDISVLKAHQRELAEQARHDSLTGLPNRRAFGERLGQALARARRNPQTLGVLYVDLDGFKGVNDRYGHAAGDKLLAEVAKRLLTCVRLTDCVCRLAGDEFTVILEGAGNPGEMVRICQRIVERLSVPHDMDGDAVVVSPSIGAAIMQSGETGEALCQRADAAMYAAKHAGKAGFVMSKAPITSDAEDGQALRQGAI